MVSNTEKRLGFLHVVNASSCDILSLNVYYLLNSFRYTCSRGETGQYHWKIDISGDCCQTCDGEVFKPDEVITRKVGNDVCRTVEIETCRKIPGTNKNVTNKWFFVFKGFEKAFIDVSIQHQSCCSHERGNNRIKITKIIYSSQDLFHWME